MADLVAIAGTLGIDLDVERARGSDLVLPRIAGSSWPWILPVVALLATIAGLWGLPKIRKWRLTATSPLAVDGGVGEAGNPAGDRVATPRRIWRIVDGPSGLGDVASLEAAIGVADDGDVVECAFSGVRDEQPCVMVGRRLTLRAAPGHDPVLRFSPPAGIHPAAGLSVVSGSFVLEGVGLRLVPASSGTSALFVLGGGATLEAEGALLEIREGVEWPSVERGTGKPCSCSGSGLALRGKIPGPMDLPARRKEAEREATRPSRWCGFRASRRSARGPSCRPRAERPWRWSGPADGA